MTIGQWLGDVVGQWLGNSGEVDPNAMSGSASFSITANATLTEAPQEQNVISGGGIYHQDKRRKATLEDKPNKHLDAIIAKSFKEIFSKLTNKKASKEVQKKANKIVGEYAETYRPTVNEVNWTEFNRDLQAVQLLLNLYNKEFEENQKAITEKLLFDLIENDNIEFLLMH